ncbi:MAG TPA: CAP domain-containing protein, partial [Thermoanaerobaculia bacterium]|nr:CAP domain-containing protein [Thermoanaerobaculia bacterium]
RPSPVVFLCVKTKALLSLGLLAALPAWSQTSGEAVREDLTRLINVERTRAGSPPLHLDEALTRAAQQHAEEISRKGALESGSSGDMRRWLRMTGYQAHEWTENVISSGNSLDEVLRYWKGRNPNTFRSLMNAQYRDLGIGVSKLDGTPLYSFLFAVPQADYFARETADLHDSSEVREEMLARVNAARKRSGLKPLRLNGKLDRSAQRHAEDMLARGYFAHRSPAGTTVRERSKVAGYDWRNIGENIAFGQTSVPEVVETWLDSPGHRRNILNPAFTELGVGLALGKGQDGKYQVLWVQNFGAPRG